MGTEVWHWSSLVVLLNMIYGDADAYFWVLVSWEVNPMYLFSISDCSFCVLRRNLEMFAMLVKLSDRLKNEVSKTLSFQVLVRCNKWWRSNFHLWIEMWVMKGLQNPIEDLCKSIPHRHLVQTNIWWSVGHKKILVFLSISGNKVSSLGEVDDWMDFVWVRFCNLQKQNLVCRNFLGFQ